MEQRGVDQNRFGEVRVSRTKVVERGGINPPRLRSVLAATAAVVAVAGMFLVLPIGAGSSRIIPAAGINLTPANWGNSCSGDGSSSGVQWNGATTGSYVHSSDWASSVGSGYADELISAGTTVGSSTAESSQYFFLASSGGTCYTPGLTHSVTVTYDWEEGWAGVADGWCATGQSTSYSMLITLYGDIHSNTGGWVGTSHSSASILNTGGTFYCPALSSGIDVGNITTSDGQQLTNYVSFSGSVTSGVHYDFFTSVVVEAVASTGFSTNANEYVTLNSTMSLTEISCPLCT